MKTPTVSRDALIAGESSDLLVSSLIFFEADSFAVLDLRDLLRVFTDAAAHVPRHRRIKSVSSLHLCIRLDSLTRIEICLRLFVRFVETLGAREFLSAVTMLLLDKNLANDATALPLAVVESFPVDIQLAVSLILIEASACRRGTDVRSSDNRRSFTTSKSRVDCYVKYQSVNPMRHSSSYRESALVVCRSAFS